MTDKLRATQPLDITFSEGEQPSGQKLTAMAKQSRVGSGVIERAIGDPWNSSGDTTLINYPLQLPNLARMLGENQYLNPAIYPLNSTFVFRENIGSKYRGKNAGYLSFIPASTTFTFFETTGQFTNLVSEEYEVGDPNKGGGLLVGEYWVSTDNGKFRIDSELLLNEQIQYEVDASSQSFIDEEVLPGISPDPRQQEFTSCRVSEAGGIYYLHLPPRRPLNFTGLGFQGEESRPSRYPADIDIGAATGNEATDIPPFEDYKYWQSAGVDALDDAHYRYRLPLEISESTFSVGQDYPAGFMYLYDKASNSIIEDVIFKKPSNGDPRGWVIQVESATFDFSAIATSDESEASYNSTGLVLVACAAPLSRSLWALTSAFLRHEHGNDNTLEPTISHLNLDGLNPPTANAQNEHTARYPTYIPRWTSSRWNQDEHTSLLSRAGAQSTTDRYRDPNNNAMLGHLVLANSVADSNNVFLDAANPDTSFGLYFGDLTGPNMRGSSATNITLSGNFTWGTTSVGSATGISPSTDSNNTWRVNDHVWVDSRKLFFGNEASISNVTPAITGTETGGLSIASDDGGSLVSATIDANEIVLDNATTIRLNAPSNIIYINSFFLNTPNNLEWTLNGNSLKVRDSSVVGAAYETKALFRIESNSTLPMGMAIGSPNDGVGSIWFTDQGDSDIGQIRYEHSDNSMYIRGNNSDRMRLTGNGDLIVGNSILGSDSGETLQVLNSLRVKRVGSTQAWMESERLIIDGNPLITGSGSINVVSIDAELQDFPFASSAFFYGINLSMTDWNGIGNGAGGNYSSEIGLRCAVSHASNMSISSLYGAQFACFVESNSFYTVGNIGTAVGVDITMGSMNTDGCTTTTASSLRVGNPTNALTNYAIKHANTTANLSTSGVWNNASSGEYKENVEPIDEATAVATVMELDPVTYDSVLAPEENTYAGFIAEELPAAVSRKDGKTVNPMDFIAMLTKVVQVQQQKIEELEAAINGS